MTYGSEHGNTTIRGQHLEMGSRAFFLAADREFAEGHPYAHRKGLFSLFFDYDRFRGKRVLEVGCGLGTMLHQWAEHKAKVVGIDLSTTAIEQTRKRFDLFNLDGQVIRSDAERLPFRDSSFDFVYSWGVLHHTPDTKCAVREIARVIKAGGSIGLMLYHKNSYSYWFWMILIEGIIHMERRFLSDLQLTSRYTDGYEGEGNPHTRVFSKEEVKRMLEGFDTIRMCTLSSTKVWRSWFSHCFPYVNRFFPDFLYEFCERRFGWLLWITAVKTGPASMHTNTQTTLSCHSRV